MRTSRGHSLPELMVGTCDSARPGQPSLLWHLECHPHKREVTHEVGASEEQRSILSPDLGRIKLWLLCASQRRRCWRPAKDKRWSPCCRPAWRRHLQHRHGSPVAPATGHQQWHCASRLAVAAQPDTCSPRRGMEHGDGTCSPGIHFRWRLRPAVPNPQAAALVRGGGDGRTTLICFVSQIGMCVISGMVGNYPQLHEKLSNMSF